MNKFFTHIDASTVFVGHSLGCPFGLQYLAKNNLKIDHFVLVAPPYTNLGWPQLLDMMQNFPPKQATSVAKQFSILASDNDPYIPLSHIKKYEKLLSSKAIVLSNREHLWQSKVPEILYLLS